MTIRLKRIYLPPEKADGLRVLVERLWPRGLKKEAAAVDLWLKDIAPSHELRKWFGHDPERWDAFKARYRDEMQSPERQTALQNLRERAARQTVTLVFAARDEDLSAATVILEELERT